MRIRSCVAHRLHLGCIAATVLAGSIARSTDAKACTSGADPKTGHYYAVIEAFNVANVANRGESALIYTDNLNNDAEDSSSFVTHEMWYGVTGDASYWVEVGVLDGAADTPCFLCLSNDVFKAVFWADNRNGGGFNEHFPNVSWEQDQWYDAEVAFAGSACSWNVVLGGHSLGTSTSNCAGTTRALLAGLESTTTSSTARVDGRVKSWSAEDNNNKWTTWSPVFYANCPADIEFTDSSHSETKEELHGPF
jgi:hypothetical protein